MVVCGVDGCGSPATGRGFCNKHYQRWYRHGDPTAGDDRQTKSGQAIQWLKAHVRHADARNCLTWPFARFPTGRAKIGFEGRTTFAYRVMCCLAHGDPPTAQHEVAHSCGRGHEGCVNPAHLRWATSAENGQDMVRHGTSTRGTRNPMVKLTEDDVRSIRALAGTLTQAKLAAHYGVHPQHVHCIVVGKAWGWLA